MDVNRVLMESLRPHSEPVMALSPKNHGGKMDR